MKRDQSPVCYGCGHDLADSTYPGQPSGELACICCTRNGQLEKQRREAEAIHQMEMPKVLDRYISTDMMHEIASRGPRIVAAAVKHKGILAIGTRHVEIIHALVEAGVSPPASGDQGFLDSYGRFLDRQAAGRVAINAGQITAMKWPGMGLDSSEVFPRETVEGQVHG